MRGVDLFCGGGGMSAAIQRVTGQSVAVAVNHWPVAIAVHSRNHPGSVHLLKDLREVRPREACPDGRADFIWASPDCRDHSRAKGGRPRENGLRSLPDVVPEWIRELCPRLVGVENVPELMKWGPLDSEGKPIKARAGEYFQRWLGRHSRARLRRGPSCAGRLTVRSTDAAETALRHRPQRRHANPLAGSDARPPG